MFSLILFNCLRISYVPVFRFFTLQFCISLADNSWMSLIPDHSLQMLELTHTRLSDRSCRQLSFHSGLWGYLRAEYHVALQSCEKRHQNERSPFRTHLTVSDKAPRNLPIHSTITTFTVNSYKTLKEVEPCLFTLAMCFQSTMVGEGLFPFFSCRYSLGNTPKKNKINSPWLNRSRL